ncbi:MAG: CHAT domain-containing protein, partial [Planctomycetes bacterium]|nr:CHAT domain-containing protein [Planctomycetota bacterium]
KRLFVCADAALAAVPFAALPGAKPGTALLDEFEIVHLEMAQDLVPVAASKPGTGALVVGGVDYGKSELLPSSAPPPLLVMVDRAPGDGKRWDPLPGTAREAELLHKRVPGDLLSGATATEGRFRELCRGKEVLHLATHGYVRTDRLARTLELRGEAARFDAAMERQVAVGTDPMLLAGVVFAGANTGDGGAGDDGLLTSAEASWLNLDGVRVAVLSACETGRGTPAAGEGTLGLVRGFRLAGARTVVASLWRVDDAATALLMERFYEGLLGRELTPSAALREAASAVRGHEDRDGKRPYAAPRYWAAFVAYGS